jgi:hypothetical protein
MPDLQIFYDSVSDFSHDKAAGTGRARIHYSCMTDMVNACSFVNMACKADQWLLYFNKAPDTSAADMKARRNLVIQRSEGRLM